MIFQRVAEGAVLLHTAEEVYFGLNPVGARIWELLPPVCATVDELCDELGKAYPGVERDRFRTDVEELLSELAGSGLVTTNGGTAADDPSTSTPGR